MKRSKLLEALAQQIAQIQKPHPVRVAIDGVDASGKTTLADELAAFIEAKNRPVIRASIDGFHNPARVRHARGNTSPEGYYFDSFNYDALIKQLLIPLGPGGTLQYASAVFDYRRDEEINHEPRRAEANSILLFDGVFLLRDELSAHWDFSVFVDAKLDVTLRRALARDLKLFGTSDEVERRYTERYIPGQQIYLDECEPGERANVIVDNNDPNGPTLTLHSAFSDVT